MQENNTLIISKGDFRVFHDIILAASSGSDVSAEFNKIKITGGNFEGIIDKNVYSLYAARGTGKLSNNSVEVSDGNFAGHVMLFAAEQNSEDLSGTENRLENNNITVTGGTFTDVCKVELQAAYADNGDILNNGITIKNLKEGKFEWLNAAHSKAGNAENNYIDISDSDLSLEMTVVAAESNSPVRSNFSNNYVSIKNSTINLSAAVHAAHNVAGTAKDSVVSIDNSTITNENGSVYIYGAYVDNGEVSGNQVILNNTKFDFGDNKHAAFICAAMVEDGSAHDNSVSLIGNNEFDATGLSKVHFIGAKGSGIFSDNVLLLDRWKGQVSSVSNFEGIKFSNIAWESGATILKIQHQPYYDDFIEDLLIDSGETDISVTSFIVGNDSFIFTGGIDSHLGESMTLVNSVDKVKFNPVYDGKGQEVSFSSSLTEDVKGYVTNEPDANGDGGSVVLTLEEKTEQSSQMEIVSNNRNMSVTFLGQAAELVGDTLSEPPHDYQWGPRTFAVINNANVKYESSGRLEVDGFNFIAGMANSTYFKDNLFRINLFAELGEGDFRESMCFGSVTRSVDGRIRYWGLGSSTRFLLPCGAYFEGSLRAGHLYNEIDHGLIGADGNNYGYSIRSYYIGAHAGLGWLFPIADWGKLELFGKYFYTHLPSDDANVRAKDDFADFSFESVDNSRVRTGLRLYLPSTEIAQGYIGAAYEYDFSPDSDVTVNGYEIHAENKLRGSTGIGEIGLRFAKKDSPWLMDVRFRGYFGQREGESLKLQAEYAF